LKTERRKETFIYIYLHVIIKWLNTSDDHNRGRLEVTRTTATQYDRLATDVRLARRCTDPTDQQEIFRDNPGSDTRNSRRLWVNVFHGSRSTAAIMAA